MRKRIFAAIAAVFFALCIAPAGATTVTYYGNLVGGTVAGTTGGFSGAVTVQSLSSSGGVAAGGAITGATTGAFSGAVTVGSLSSSGAIQGTTGTFSGQVSSNAAIVAGAATPPGYSSGDLAASRGASCGAVDLGGSSSGATIDYGCSTSSAVTIGASTYVAGNVESSGGSFYTTAAQGLSFNNTSAGCSTVIGSGGGPVSSVTAQAWYVYVPCVGQQAAMDNSGDVGFAGEVFSRGAALGPIYTSSGAALSCSTATHVVIGTIAQSSTTVTVTLSGNAAFTSSSSYVVTDSIDQAGGSNAASSYATYTSGTQFTLTNVGAFGNDHWIAIGC